MKLLNLTMFFLISFSLLYSQTDLKERYEKAKQEFNESEKLILTEEMQKNLPKEN